MTNVSGNSTWANKPSTSSPLNATRLNNIEDALNTLNAGKAAASHTHDVGDIDATGTADGTTYLRGDGTWSTPSGSGVTDHGALTGLGDDDHTQYALADGSRGSFAAASHTHPATQISDSTTTGRSVVTAADAAAARTAIGAAAVGTIGAVIVSGAPTSGQVPTATSGTTATWQTPAGGGGITSFAHQMLPGYYYHTTHGISGVYNTFVLVAGTLYVAPLVVGESTPIDMLSMSVQTAGGAGDQIRMGIYAASRLQPSGTPIVEGVVSAASTGTKGVSVSATLTPGLYMLAMVGSGGTAQVRAFTSSGVRWSNNGHTAGDYYSTTHGGVAMYSSGASASSALPNASSLGGRSIGHGVSSDIVFMSVRAA